jgi:hypothetical protein
MLVWKTKLVIPAQANASRRGDDTGKWLFGGADFAPFRCPHCDELEEVQDAVESGPAFLALDFLREDNSLFDVPLKLNLPLGGGRIEYNLVGFCTSARSHSRCFVRAGPMHFQVRDDQTISWARVIGQDEPDELHDRANLVLYAAA